MALIERGGDRAIALGRVLGAPESGPLTEAEATAAIAVLREHKVSLQARRNLGDSRSALWNLLNDEVRPQLIRQRTLPDTWRVIEGAGRAGGYTVAAMKGAAARHWYPDPSTRHMGDFDVWVPDRPSAWDLCWLLLRYGWQFNGREFPWFKRDGEDAIYGVINLVSGDVTRHDVDIHFGSYSVRHCGRIPLGADRLTSGDGEMARLADEENLAVIIANAAGDYAVGLKDVNDLLQVTARGNIEWERVRRLVDDAGLLTFAAAFAEAGRRLYVDVEQARDLLDTADRGIACGRPFRGRVPSATAPPRQRITATIGHAWRLGRRQSIATGLWSWATAAVYYNARLRPRVVRFGGGPRRHAPVATPYRCVRLIPVPFAAGLADVAPPRVGPETVPDVAARSVDGLAVAVSGRITFVPTVLGRMSRRRVRRTVDGLRGTGTRAET